MQISKCDINKIFNNTILHIFTYTKRRESYSGFSDQKEQEESGKKEKERERIRDTQHALVCTIILYLLLRSNLAQFSKFFKHK